MKTGREGSPVKEREKDEERGVGLGVIIYKISFIFLVRGVSSHSRRIVLCLSYSVKYILLYFSFSS